MLYLGVKATSVEEERLDSSRLARSRVELRERKPLKAIRASLWVAHRAFLMIFGFPDSA